MAGRFTSPIAAEYDSSGNPLAGAKLEFYESGTSTPLDTYSDDDLSTANANPVVADSAGRFGSIFLKEQAYKVILKSSAGATIWTADPVRAAEPISTATRAISTTTTQSASDNGKLILADATSGPFTYTLLPAATAGDGFTVYVKKVDSSSNAVTVDADGSEAIDGDSDVSLPVQWNVVGIRSNGTAWRIIVPPLTAESIPLPQSYIAGLVISNNATDADHDIDITAGVARDADNEANMVLASAITKRIDAAWAAGDGNGGLDTGSVTTDTWYHVWLIRRSDTGVVDALFSTSATSPTMPSNYDQKRRIGAVLTDGSANIIAFSQDGDEFLWNTPVTDVNTSPGGTTAILHTLSVPSGIKVRAMATVLLFDLTLGSNTGLIVTSPDQTDVAASAGRRDIFLNTDAESGSVRVLTRTNTSSQIRTRQDNAETGLTLEIVTHGWVDPRGRDS